jgi:hypothetical protein
VQWRTAQGASGGGEVQFGAAPGALTSTARGGSWAWKDVNTGTMRTESNATLTGLTPGAIVYYRVGSAADGFSAVASFVATRAAFSPAAPQRVAWIGDLGLANAQALPYLAKEAAAGVYDMVIHGAFNTRHAPSHATATLMTPKPNRT